MVTFSINLAYAIAMPASHFFAGMQLCCFVFLMEHFLKVFNELLSSIFKKQGRLSKGLV